MKLPACMVLVLAAGCVAAVADTLEDKFQGLKDALAKKNVTEVKKLAVEVYPLATTAAYEPAPQEESEKEAWSSRVAYAKSVQLYAEYALSAATAGAPPATVVDLLSTLEQTNPKSQYLDAAYGPYLVALNQTGAASKIQAIAEKGLANFPENEDLLLYLMDSAASRNQPDRALTYANRLTAVGARHSKPEGVSAAQWERKRSAGLGHGYFVAGVIYAQRGQFAPADKNLRAALPYLQGDQTRMGEALFHLGVANYQLGKMTLSKARVLEGAKFSEQSAAISGPFADQARHNMLVMRNDAAKMR